MFRLVYLLVLLVVSSAVLATGEFSTGGAELLKFKGYGMGRFDIYGEEDADPDMGFSAIADVTWIPTLNDWLDAKIEFKFKPTKYDGGSHDKNIVLFLEVLTLNAQVTDGFAITAGQFKRPFGGRGKNIAHDNLVSSGPNDEDDCPAHQFSHPFVNLIDD